MAHSNTNDLEIGFSAAVRGANYKGDTEVLRTSSLKSEFVAGLRMNGDLGLSIPSSRNRAYDDKQHRSQQSAMMNDGGYEQHFLDVQTRREEAAARQALSDGGVREFFAHR